MSTNIAIVFPSFLALLNHLISNQITVDEVVTEPSPCCGVPEKIGFQAQGDRFLVAWKDLAGHQKTFHFWEHMKEVWSEPFEEPKPSILTGTPKPLFVPIVTREELEAVQKSLQELQVEVKKLKKTNLDLNDELARVRRWDIGPSSDPGDAPR